MEDTRLHLLIALAPTGHWDAAVPRARVGLWKVALECKKACRVDIAIQSDQSDFLHSRQGRQSYFDDKDYRQFLSGHPMDSYGYPCPSKSVDCLLENGRSPVTRLGTVNALSTWRTDDPGSGIPAFGGYLARNGRPAIYSSTAAPLPQTAVPVARIAGAYPTEDSPLNFGVLGAGARDGGAVALRGTSSASAMATRAAAFVAIGETPTPPPVYPPAHPDKVGRTPDDDGRERRIDRTRVRRFPSYP